MNSTSSSSSQQQQQHQQQQQNEAAQEERVSKMLAQDRPTIDSAVKSFLSLICAKALTQSTTDNDNNNKTTTTTTTNNNDITVTPAQIQSISLQFGRIILKQVNSFKFPIHDTVAYTKAQNPKTTKKEKESLLELQVVSKLWNGLIDSEQKPSKFLGRCALQHAWKKFDFSNMLSSKNNNDDNNNDNDNYLYKWLQEFEHLLYYYPAENELDLDNDAALLWDADGGEQEFQKRRQRRQDRAKALADVAPS